MRGGTSSPAGAPADQAGLSARGWRVVLSISALAWFGLIERTMLRVDVAKTVNSSAPVQVWVGVTHAF